MTGITRRRLLALGAGAAFIAIARPRAVMAEEMSMPMDSDMPMGPALPLPPLVEPDASGLVKLKIEKGRHSFVKGSEAESAGVNGAYLGPLVRLKNGDKITLCVENGMDEDTTLHWHGLFVPAALDGGPHNIIAAGGRWQPQVTVGQPASFNWFHPHLDGGTARQAHMGIAGLMVVGDGRDGERGLPENYGVDDIPLVLQDRRVIAGGHVYAPDMMDLMHGFRGDTLIVNGVAGPQARVPAAVVRLRILNGANARNFHIRLSDDRPLHVVASDGGYIDRPEPVGRLTVSPGERYEVLVDFGRGGSHVDLLTAGDDDGGDDLPLMRFVTDGVLKGGVTTLPARLDGPGAPDAQLAVRRRSLTFDERMAANMKLMMGGNGHGVSHMNMDHMNMGDMGMGGMDMANMDHDMHRGRSTAEAGPAVDAATSGIRMAIAGKPFDMKRIDVEAGRDSWEIWELTTQEMAHPFHIHGASFRILTLNGKAPPAHRGGWKDTALIDGKAELLIHFNREATRSHPFMFHCHVLEHEDVGMMGQFVTV
ncbi:MAG: multicopper oxidase CueO [Rhizobiales bacterium]|nr:multicopper oxidase CueO [Hyphomicrobiales bacterium]OJX98802.1 MAG: multicopper oxidase [Rhizobiales bacterium 63-22]